MIRVIERAAIDLLFDGDEPIITALRDQYKQASIKTIEMTGVGVYINYVLPESAINLPSSLSFCFGDVGGRVEPLKNGVGFLLCVESGLLSFLEIYTFGELWPEHITDFSLFYIRGTRDLSDVKRACHSITEAEGLLKKSFL